MGEVATLASTPLSKYIYSEKVQSAIDEVTRYLKTKPEYGLRSYIVEHGERSIFVKVLVDLTGSDRTEPITATHRVVARIFRNIGGPEVFCQLLLCGGVRR